MMKKKSQATNLRIEFPNTKYQESDEMEEGEASTDDELDNSKEKHGTVIQSKIINPTESNDAWAEEVDFLSDDEVVDKKLAARTKRFGAATNPNAVAPAKLVELYKSLGLQKIDFYREGWRENAIHMWGIEGLDLDELSVYFHEYNPVSVEWVTENKCKCVWTKPNVTKFNHGNIVFKNKMAAAKALLDLSCPIRTSQKSKKDNVKVDTGSEQKNKPSTSESLSNDSSGSSSSEDNSSSSSSDDSSSEEATDVPKPPVQVQEQEKNSPFKIDKAVSADDIDVTLPSGQWRLGVPFKEIPAILLRYAHCLDRPQRDVKKKIEYFVPVGKPDRQFRKAKRRTDKLPRNDSRDRFVERTNRGGPREESRTYKDLDNPIKADNPWGFIAQNWHKKPEEIDMDYQALLQQHVIDKNSKRKREDVDSDIGYEQYESDRHPSKVLRQTIYDESETSSGESDDVVEWKSKSKIPRMRMYADAEQEKRRVNPRLPLHSRIGVKSANAKHSVVRKPGFDLRQKLSGRW